MPEETEAQNLSQENKKFVEVDAPERLIKGQNLYDQEPFLSLVESIFESSGVTPNKLRTAISLFAKEHRVNPKLQTTALLRKVNLSVSPTTSILWDSQVKILETLQMYPYWSEYIVLKMQDALYFPNGSFSKTSHGKTEPPALSYANWVAQKLQREKNLWLVGIEEVFPQDVGHPTTSLPNITGAKSGTRRYRILKAAGIIPEKR